MIRPTGPGLPGEPEETLDAVLADDALLERLSRREPSDADLGDPSARLLAALTVDVDTRPVPQGLPAPARVGRRAGRDVLPASVVAVDRPRRRLAAGAAVTLVLAVGGTSAAAAVVGVSPVDALRSVVAEYTGADWIAPAEDRAAAGDGSAEGREGSVETARDVLAEVQAALEAGDVEAAERGLARAEKVLAELPADQRAAVRGEANQAADDVRAAGGTPLPASQGGQGNPGSNQGNQGNQGGQGSDQGGQGGAPGSGSGSGGAVPLPVVPGEDTAPTPAPSPGATPAPSRPGNNKPTVPPSRDSSGKPLVPPSRPGNNKPVAPDTSPTAQLDGFGVSAVELDEPEDG